MIDFLESFGEIFLYPLSPVVDWQTPLFWGMIAILVPAGIFSIFRRFF